jgi:hypothetical protein
VVPKGNPGDTQGGQGAHTQGLILMRAQARSPPPRGRLWFSIGSPSLDRRTLSWAWVGPGLGSGLGSGLGPGPPPVCRRVHPGNTQSTFYIHTYACTLGIFSRAVFAWVAWENLGELAVRLRFDCGSA